MLSPSLFLAGLLSSAYASLFHIWKGRNLTDLLLYLVAAWLGFGLGQLVGEAHGLGLFTVGPLHVVEGTFFAWFLLFTVRWLKIGR
jgi:hypothetical protein